MISAHSHAAANPTPRATRDDLADLAARLAAMAAARVNPPAFAAHDKAFHRAVTSVTGNQTLMKLLDGVSAHTALTELPRGILDHTVADIVIAEHAAIHAALDAHDPTLARAAAPLYVDTTEQWLCGHLGNASSQGLAVLGLVKSSETAEERVGTDARVISALPLPGLPTAGRFCHGLR